VVYISQACCRGTFYAHLSFSLICVVLFICCNFEMVGKHEAKNSSEACNKGKKAKMPKKDHQVNLQSLCTLI